MRRESPGIELELESARLEWIAMSGEVSVALRLRTGRVGSARGSNKLSPPRGLESKYENGPARLTVILSREEVFNDLAKSLAGLLGRVACRSGQPLT
jgi:hypothetical protein